MKAPKSLSEALVLFGLGIILLQFRCCLAEEQRASCNQCYRESLCQMSPAAFFIEASDIGVINCTHSWIQEKFNVEEISNYLSSSCARNRLRAIIAFLFHRPQPYDVPGCSNSSACHSVECTNYMKNSTDVSFATSADHDTLGPYRMQIIAMISNELIFPEMQPSESSSMAAPLVGDGEEMEMARMIPKSDESCPTQQQYSTIEKVHLLIKTIHSVHHCKTKHLPLDMVNAHEKYHDSFLERVLLLRMSAINSIIRHADHQLNFVPQDLKLKCGIFADKRHVSKTKMILDVSRKLFKCRNCDTWSAVNVTAVNATTFNTSTLYAAALNGSSENPTISGSGNSGEEVMESNCPTQMGYLEADTHQNRAKSLKRALKGAFDCRYINCRFVSQDSIGAVYFKLAYHLGCVECMIREVCAGQINVACLQKVMPSLKTVFHAVRVLGSETTDCDFSMAGFVKGQVEKSIGNLIRFHEVLYGFSVMSAYLDVPRPDCTNDCNPIYGPSRVCDLCHAKYLASIISKLTLQVLNCSNTFVFGGERFCTPESVIQIASNCLVNYTSGVSYSTKAKEIQALAYALGSLTGCGESGAANDFLSYTPKCAYLRNAMKAGFTTFPTIDFPEYWLNTKAFTPDSTLKSLMSYVYKLSRCSSPCLPWQELCSISFSCVSRYLNCQPVNPVSPDEAYPLVGHVDMDALRSSLFPVSSFVNETIILVRPSNATNAGHWLVEISSELTVNLTTLQSGLVVDKSAFLQFESADDNSYGVRILNYYKLSDLGNYNVSKYVNGALVGDSGLSNITRKTAVLLIRPVARTERLRMKPNPPVISILEDSGTMSLPRINEFLNLNTELQDHSIPRSMFPYLDNRELDLFYEYKTMYQTVQPTAKVALISSTGSGTWYAKVAGDQFSTERFKLNPGAEFPVFTTDLYFQPMGNYYGEAWLLLNVCYCGQAHQEDKAITIRIPVEIKPVNDKPKAWVKRIAFPPIAYNTTTHPNNGFSVSLLNQYVSDIETTNLGITVFDALSSRIGKWYYKLKNGTWTELKQRRLVEHGSSYGDIEVVRLLPDDEIKFELNDDARHWSFADAMREVRLHFMFWDMADNKSSGPEMTKMELLDPSSYSHEVFGIMLRNGCDGRPGSMTKMDKCNECGGKMKCVGCDGVPFSGARFDSCGECAGGRTGKLKNAKRDCAGTCGKAELDDCNICQQKSNGLKRSFKDCMGVCFGKAKLNRCGSCYGGTSSLNATAGVDVCGVCGGDGTSCEGCDGVTNSGKVRDVCGLCLHRSDSLFNANCTKISDFTPKSSPITGGREVEITGAGFSSFNLAKCRFMDGDREISASEVQIESKSKFKIRTPSAPAGSYRLQCSFDSGTTLFEASAKTFKFYNNSRITINTVSPSKVLIGTKNVSVNGYGFTQTDKLYCAYMVSRKSYLTQAVVLSDSIATCLLPDFAYSLSLRMTVVASMQDGSSTGLRNLPDNVWKTLEVYAAAPKALSAKLSDNLKTIIIRFDSKITAAKRSCANLFESSVVGMFGARARCYFKSLDEIAISLGVGATIVPGDAITLKGDAVFAYKQKFSYSANESISLQTSSFKPLKVKIIGPSSVGICDPFKVKAIAFGNTGGRRLLFSWNASFASDVDAGSLTANDTNDLLALRAYLSGLPSHTHTILVSSNLVRPTTSERYISYEFIVTASNFLGQVTNKSIIVQRMSVKVPIVKILGGEKQRARANRNLIINSKVRQSSCQNSMTLLQYQWEVSPMVELDVRSKFIPRLFVPSGALTGGSTYTFTLTTSFVADPAVFATASVEVTVESSMLIAKIRGGSNRVIGSGTPLTLDASPSYDPDRVSDIDEAFTWECFDSSLYPCFIPDVNDTSKMARFILPQAKRIFIEPGTLPSNATYTFKFTFTKGTRSASKDVRIRIMPGSPPIVKLRPLKRSKVNADEKVILRGYVHSSTSNSMDFWWECLDDEGGYSYINLTEPGIAKSNVRGKITRRGVSWSVLIINRGVLSEGASYKIKLNAQNNDGVGYAEMIVVVNGPPTLGTFTSDLSQGTALETLFNLQAIEGWTDDEEDLPLKYKFGYIKANGQDGFLGGISQENEAQVFLPAGEPAKNFTLTLFVDVSDNKGSTTRAVHHVIVAPISSFDLETVLGLASRLVPAFEAKDISSVIGQVTSTVNVLNEASNNVLSATANISSAIQSNIIDFKENTTSQILSMLQTVLDAETQNMIVNVISDVTKDGKLFNGLLRKDIAGSISQVIKSQLNPYVPPSTSSIKFSPLEGNDFEDEYGKSPEEIEKIIETFQNILNTSLYDNTTMQVKREFTGLINTLLKSMCSKSAYGEEASVADTALSILQSYKYDFSTNGTSDFPINCKDCENNGLAPGIFNLGSELAAKYNEWQCTTDYKCNGLCIGSVQLPQDLYSDEDSIRNNTMISNTVQLSLFNPETNSMLTENSLATPITVLVPVDKAKYNSSHATQCKYWDESSSSWKNDSCTAEKDLRTEGSKSYIVCKCLRTGTVAAFEGPAFAKLDSGPSGGSGGSGGGSPSSSGSNVTRQSPLLTFFVVLGVLGLSSFLSIGYIGYDWHKSVTQISPYQE